MHLHNGNRGEGSKSMQSTQPTDDLKLARSTEATSDQLRELSMSGDPEVRLAVAANPKAGYFILYRLVPSKIESDFDDQMLALLAVHPQIRHAWIDGLPGLLRGRLDGAPEHRLSFQTAVRLCSRPDVPGARLAELVNDKDTGLEFKELIARTCTRPDLLGVLAADESPEVRTAVAANPCRPATEFRLRVLVDLSDRLEGREVQAGGIGADETVALLLAVPGVPPERASLPSPHPSWRDPARRVTAVLLARGDAVREVPIEPVIRYSPFIQPLSDGGFVIVESTVARTDDAHNADRYDGSGRLVAQFLLYDGIEHLLADGEDRLWVGYFDEGIFGNGAHAAAGLCQFDASGQALWSFVPPEGGERIDDCYALNVADDAVWTHYYSCYDLVRIGRDGASRRWTTPLVGAGIVARDDHRVLTVGAYGKGQPIDLCHLWDLGADGLEHPRPVVTFPFLERRTHQVLARGPIVYFVDGARVFRGDIREIDPAE